jgi:hypothetical protein
MAFALAATFIKAPVPVALHPVPDQGKLLSTARPCPQVVLGSGPEGVGPARVKRRTR